MRTGCDCPFIRLAPVMAKVHTTPALRVGLPIRQWEPLWHLKSDPPPLSLQGPAQAPGHQRLSSRWDCRAAALVSSCWRKKVYLGGKREDIFCDSCRRASAGPRIWGCLEGHSPGPPLTELPPCSPMATAMQAGRRGSLQAHASEALSLLQMETTPRCHWG